jgi:predicted Zn-dependent peptidase
VYSYQDSYRDCGVFGLYLGTDARTALKAVDACAGEFGRLRRGDISSAEVEACKEQLKGHLVLGLENTSARMNRLARQELYLGKHVTLNATLKQIDQVKTVDLVTLAEDILHGNRLTAVAVGPLESAQLESANWSALD